MRRKNKKKKKVLKFSKKNMIFFKTSDTKSFIEVSILVDTWVT